MANRLDGACVLILGKGAVAEVIGRGLTQLGAEIVRDTEAAAGKAALVVIPVTDPGGMSPASLADMSDDDWEARCEAPLRAMRIAMQDAYRVLAGRGGHVVLLVPTIAMVGAAGFAPFSAVGEGARSLAKAAARAWGGEGILVNSIALTSEQLCPGAEGDVAAGKVPKALGRLPDLENDVAGYIANMVLGPAIMTGATVSLDGGNLMSL
jgi:NAD(P)-dependent dehydrogenase (short-subunit alcohol dehydrogenase family)